MTLISFGLPLWLWLGRRILNNIIPPQYILPHYLAIMTGIVSVGSAVLWALRGGYYVIEKIGAFPWISVILYSSFFCAIFATSARYLFKRNFITTPFVTLCLAVWAVTAISELWEMPIHFVMWPGSPDALLKGLLFSGLKLLGIPFFFATVIRAGWGPDFIWSVLLLWTLLFSAVAYGSVLDNHVMIDGALRYTGDLILIQLYRVPWFLVFLWTFYKIPRGQFT